MLTLFAVLAGEQPLSTAAELLESKEVEDYVTHENLATHAAVLRSLLPSGANTQSRPRKDVGKVPDSGSQASTQCVFYY